MSAPGAPHDLANVAFRVGRAYGMTADRGIYQAVAVQDGRITAVGRSRDELDSFIGPGTAVIDDPELVLYPAFNDTHNHQLLAARPRLRIAGAGTFGRRAGGEVPAASASARRHASARSSSAVSNRASKRPRVS